MSRTPDNPAPRYRLADAAAAVEQIRRIRERATDPDLGGLPQSISDRFDVTAAVSYVEQRRNVGAAARAAELPHRALLIEYLRQQDVEAHERRLLRLLQTGHQLHVRAAAYGEPMGIPSRQAIHSRRKALTSKYPAGDHQVNEGQARQWLDDHSTQIRAIADCLLDHRDDLAGLIPAGPAQAELTACIDTAGAAMSSRRASQELCTAVALAVHLLPSEAVETAADPEVRDQIEAARRLLW